LAAVRFPVLRCSESRHVPTSSSADVAKFRRQAPTPPIVSNKLEDLLHEYRKDLFHADHGRKQVEEITRECVEISDEVLRQKYEYHFHRLPDANRAEIINMINNYTREAILPPVVHNLVRRQLVLERRLEAMSRFLERTLEALAGAEQAAAP
jgi:hypothetical protein